MPGVTSAVLCWLALLSAHVVETRLRPPAPGRPHDGQWAALALRVARLHCRRSRVVRVAVVAEERNGPATSAAEAALKLLNHSYRFYSFAPGGPAAVPDSSLPGDRLTCQLQFATSPSFLLRFMQRDSGMSPRNNLLIVFALGSNAVADPDHGAVLRSLWEGQHILHAGALTARLYEPPTGREAWSVYDPFAPAAGGGRGAVLAVAAHAQKLQVPDGLLGDARGYPLRVTAFRRHSSFQLFGPDGQPCQLCPDGVAGYRGLDARILQAVAAHFNFTVVVAGPRDRTRFGARAPDGSFTGALGDLVYRRADVAFNSMFQKDYGTDDIEFVRPFGQDSVCLIVPKAALTSKIHLLSFIFRPEAQCAFLGVYAAVAALWLLVDRAERALTRRRRAAVDAFIEALHLLTASPVSVRLHGPAERCLVLAGMLFFTVVCYIVQAKMVSVLYTPSYHDIDTLEEFNQSGLTISTTSPNLANVLGELEEGVEPKTLMDHLIRKVVVLGSEVRAAPDHVAYFRNTAAIARASDAEFGDFDKYRGAAGGWLLHLVAECPRQYLTSFAVPRGSAYLQALDGFVGRALETGLVDKWDRDEFFGIMLREGKDYVRSHRTTIESTDQVRTRLFGLSDLQLPFVVWCCGAASSIFAFLCELFFGKIFSVDRA